MCAWSTLLSSRAPWRRRSCLRRASRWRTWRKPPRMPAVPASSESTVALPAGVALHARPAATFVKTALRFRSRVTVGTVDNAGKVADAKSILAVLALGAQGGSVLRLSAEGGDAPDALDALASCVSGLDR